jgi:phosphomannomutase/phosphoglucomutase
MNMELGKFNRKIEPNMHTLKKVAEEVKKNNADFGAGFDCDADRVELVDDKGSMVSGNYVLALAVEEVLSNYNGNNRIIVINDATSNVVKEVAERHNAKVEEVEVGEINVVKRMYEVKSPISGEGSNGGVIIPPARCREGLMTLIAIIRLLARTKKKLSDICEEFPKYYTPRQAFSSEGDTVKIKGLIEKKFREKGYEIRKTGDETGGLKIVIDEKSWLWFRDSKTELGAFRIIADSNDESKANEILQQGVDAFKEAEAELR